MHSEYFTLNGAYDCRSCNTVERFSGVKPSGLRNRPSVVRVERERDISENVVVNVPINDPMNNIQQHHERHHEHDNHNHRRSPINNNYYYYDRPYNRYYGDYLYYDQPYGIPKIPPYLMYQYQPVPLTFWEMVRKNVISYPAEPTEYDTKNMANFILNLCRIMPCGVNCRQFCDYFITTFLRSYPDIYKMCSKKHDVELFFSEFQKEVNNYFGFEIRKNENVWGIY